MSLEISIESERFTNAMTVFGERLGIAAQKIVRYEAKALLGEVIKWTPPFKTDTTTGTPRMIGRTAVERDIRRAIYPLDESEWKSESIKKAITGKDTKALEAILKNFMRLPTVQIVPFAPTWHRSAQNNRGHVRKNQGVFTFDKDGVRKYTKRIQSHVGMAKGSWAAAYAAVGGKPQKWTVAARNKAAGSISIMVDRMASPTNPTFEVTSTAHGVVDNTRLIRQIKHAMNVRVGAMQQKCRRMLANPTKYANLFSQYQ